MKTDGFYTIGTKINEVQDELNSFQILKLQEKVKRLPKKSEERKKLNANIQQIKSSLEYQLLQKELDTLEWCSNRVL